jgi:hypothetical protein
MSETDVKAVSLETLGCYMGGLGYHKGVSVATSIPPAVIAPSRQHDLQLDRSFPAYPVGTGEKWPSNARVEDGYSRRMPVGLLWQFAKDDRIWKVDPETSIDPIHALGIAARDSVAVGPESVVGLVIPNWLRQSQQQALLDTASSRGGNWHLVWRPIAAATHWLRCFPLTPPETNSRRCIGKLITLHLGLFECELTVIEIVAEPYGGGVVLLPARLRPDKDKDFRAGMSDFLSTSVAGINGEDSSREIWQRLWTTPWLIREMNAWSGKAEAKGSRYYVKYDPPAVKLQRQPESASRVIISGIEWRNESIKSIANWIDERLEDSGPVEGAVVTGELASTTKSGKSLGIALLERRISPSKILVSGSSAEINALTAGAATQVERIRQSLPSYLTKLPLMRTVVSKMGLPEWISLLSDDDTYVPGGQKWSRPVPIGGIRIPGSKVLKLAVDHEDFEGVREASITLPGTITANQAAEIHVEITPAQGNARIELIPLPRVKTQKPIVANLKRMDEVVDKQNRTLTPNGYLDFYPRIAPPLLERRGSATAWSSVAENLVKPLIQSRLAQYWPTESIIIIKDKLREKHNAASARNITAIGSDGFVSTYGAQLDQLVAGAFSLIKSRDLDRTKNAKRLIAYTSTASPLIQEYLISHSRVLPERDEDCRMIGNCLRDPIGICDFLMACQPGRLTTHHIRTIAELACYRATAMELIATDRLNEIYESIAEEFRSYSRYSNLNLHFRYLTLCVAFLLRRRIFDDTFVPPSSKLAAMVKQTCLNVIQGYENGTIHVMGGAVDLPAVMRQLIKYVDREGQGAFVLAT